MHPNVPYKGGPEIILTCGATDGFAKSLECLSNIWDPERDWIREREGILVEEFAYMNAIQAAQPRGLNVVPVVIDDEGMTAYGEVGSRTCSSSGQESGKETASDVHRDGRPESDFWTLICQEAEGDLQSVPQVRHYHYRRRPLLVSAISFGK